MTSIFLKLDSSSLNDSQPSDDFIVNFRGGIPLEQNKKYMVALINANLWYSWHNVSSAFGNNTLRYHNDTEWKIVQIPNGIYQLTDINDYLHEEMIANSDYTTDASGENVFDIEILPNYNNGKCKVILTNNYQLDLSYSLLNELLGFESQIVDETMEGENPVDITRGVNSLMVHCSIASGSYENSYGSDIIYSFVPRSSPYSNIEVAPYFPIYLPINEYKNIFDIRMRLTDQKGRRIDLNGEITTYILHIKESGTITTQ